MRILVVIVSVVANSIWHAWPVSRLLLLRMYPICAQKALQSCMLDVKYLSNS